MLARRSAAQPCTRSESVSVAATEICGVAALVSEPAVWPPGVRALIGTFLRGCRSAEPATGQPVERLSECAVRNFSTGCEPADGLRAIVRVFGARVVLVPSSALTEQMLTRGRAPHPPAEELWRADIESALACVLARWIHADGRLGQCALALESVSAARTSMPAGSAGISIPVVDRTGAVVVTVWCDLAAWARLAGYGRFAPVPLGRVGLLRGGEITVMLEVRIRATSLLPLLLGSRIAGRLPLSGPTVRWAVRFGSGGAFGLRLLHAREGCSQATFTLSHVRRGVMRADFGLDWDGVEVTGADPSGGDSPIDGRGDAATGSRSALSHYEASLFESLSVNLDVELGTTTVSVRELLDLETGAMLRLTVPDERVVVLRLNGEPVADARLLRSEGAFWLEIVSVTDHEKREGATER